MTHFEQFTAATAKPVELSSGDAWRILEIQKRVRGWSDGRQYAFFKTLLALPSVRDVLMLGVYHGRDIAFMRDCCLELGRKDVWIVGVDKFSDTECGDWPKDSLGKGWQEAGFGPPPSLPQATRNIGSSHVRLIESNADDFLATTQLQFDAVYEDTSHDFETCARRLRQIPRVCRGDAIICGDDYSDESPNPGGSWGVKRAVNAAFTSHTVFADWIWVSSKSLLKS